MLLLRWLLLFYLLLFYLLLLFGGIEFRAAQRCRFAMLHAAPPSSDSLG